MIIDSNCHLGHWPFRALANSDPAGLLGLMDRWGVTQAWVGPFEALFYRDSGQANRDLLRSLAPYRDRLIPWAALNPGFPGWEQDWREAREGGCVGVRLYPNYHGYALGDDCCLKLLAQAQELDLPVAVYERVVDERLHHWHCKVPPTEMALAPLVQRYPRLRLIQCGSSAGAAAAPPGVCVEISRVEGIGGVGALVAALGPERVLFGSHAPYFYLQAALLKVVEAGLGEEARQALLHGNARRLLGEP